MKKLYNNLQLLHYKRLLKVKYNVVYLHPESGTSGEDWTGWFLWRCSCCGILYFWCGDLRPTEEEKESSSMHLKCGNGECVNFGYEANPTDKVLYNQKVIQKTPLLENYLEKIKYFHSIIGRRTY